MAKLDSSLTAEVTHLQRAALGDEIPSFDLANYSQANAWLHRTWEWVAPRHPTAAAHAYVQSHWSRYVGLLESLPPLNAQSRVLEIGASIVSSALKLAGARVSVAYHELEPEWKSRFQEEGIEGIGLEILRDSLPWQGETFDLILCDQVLEHLPLLPDYFMQQMLWLLKPNGRLIVSVPNFATWEKRLSLLRGHNPQDLMDRRWIYYAHHREPVMREMVALVEQNGGQVVKSEWKDFPTNPNSWMKRAPWLRPLLFKRRIAPFMHHFFPAMRDFIVVHAQRAVNARFPEERRKPPLLDSKEFNA